MNTDVIGHRGFSGRYPENTKRSLIEAANLGLTWIEIDVQPTQDGELVVCHDFTVDRCSNGVGRVDSYTLEAIRQLDFGGWFDPQFTSEQIMTVQELLDIVQEHNLAVNIEVKLDTTNARKVVRTLKKALILSNIEPQRVILSSFSHLVMNELAAQCSAYPLGVITEKLSENDITLLGQINAYSCHLDYEHLSQDDIDRLRSQNYRIMCYTVNPSSQFTLMDQVDAIFSDFPDHFLAR